MLSIKKGEDMDENYLSKLYELDKIAYGGNYVGELFNMTKRWKQNKSTFIAIEEDGKPLAYINILPCSKKLADEVILYSDKIIDDEIGVTLFTDEDFLYKKEENYLYILSVVNSLSEHTYKSEEIHKKNSKQEKILKDNVSLYLIKGYKEYIKELNEKDYKISKIFATTVTKGGRNWARKIGLEEYRTLSDKNIVYLKEY